VAIDWKTQEKLSRVKKTTDHVEHMGHFQLQESLNCMPIRNRGCNGSYPSKALFYMRDRGLRSEPPYPYVGKTNT